MAEMLPIACLRLRRWPSLWPRTCGAVPLLSQSTQAGDTTAFVELTQRHPDRVYSFVLGVVGDPSDGEDLAQETSVEGYTCAAGWFVVYTGGARCPSSDLRKRSADRSSVGSV